MKMNMNMKFTTTPASLVLCLASTLTTVHAKDRGWNREPNPIPNPPRTFPRASKTFHGGNGKDDCFKWEARENNRTPNDGTDFGPVICRQKCPPGYGTSKDKCVWQQTFTAHIRLQNLVQYGDSCIEDNGPQTYQVKQNGTQVAMQLQLNEARTDLWRNRTACAAKCPTEFGWGEALGNLCAFKQKYRRIERFANTKCTNEEILLIPNCARKCVDGYETNPNDFHECLWAGKTN